MALPMFSLHGQCSLQSVGYVAYYLQWSVDCAEYIYQPTSKGRQPGGMAGFIPPLLQVLLQLGPFYFYCRPL